MGEGWGRVGGGLGEGWGGLGEGWGGLRNSDVTSLKLLNWV